MDVDIEDDDNDFVVGRSGEGEHVLVVVVRTRREPRAGGSSCCKDKDGRCGLSGQGLDVALAA